MLLALALSAAHAQQPLFTFDGDRAWGKLGSASIEAGDLSGDGVGDWLLGGTGNSAGHGGGGDTVVGYVQARSGTDAAVLWSVDGSSANDDFGAALALASDRTGDGIPEVAVGAPGAGGGAGLVVILDGSTGAQLAAYPGSGSERLGISLASLPDVNADGHGELAAGAWTWRDLAGDAVGRVVLLDGASGAVLNAWEGDLAASGFGYATGACDVDGDGTADLIVGAYGTTVPAPTGEVHAYSAVTGLLLNTWRGLAGGDAFGGSVGCAGDVDGGGVPDVLVGAFRRDADSGAAYLFSSETGAVLWSGAAEQTGAHYGQHVAGVGDASGDGIPDFAVGAILHGAPGATFTGKHYLYSGRSGALLWSRTGPVTFSFSGSVGAAGDANADGLADVLVGAYGADLVVPGDYTGRVEVVLGAAQFALDAVGLELVGSGSLADGELVYFAGSALGLGPEDVGGVTVQLTAPVLLGSAVVAGGQARLLTSPAGLPSGTPVYAQAAVRRGADWVLSEAITTAVP